MVVVPRVTPSFIWEKYFHFSNELFIFIDDNSNQLWFQDSENKQYFTPDKLMEPVFGSEKIKAFGMAKYLKDHLSD